MKVTGTTKGRGFQGVVKRYGFGGGPNTHGNTKHRRPGSIGPGTDPSRVIKGKKMPGHYGAARHTQTHLRVEKVDAERNLIYIRGAVAGPDERDRRSSASRAERMAETQTNLNAAAYTALGTERDRVTLPEDAVRRHRQHAGDAPGGEGVPRQPAPGQRGDEDPRSYVVGGNQKPWKQKGTGRARQGSIRAPHWVGGGTVFGPQPRSYAQDVPRQVRALARKSALNARAREDAIFVDRPRSTSTRRRRSASSRCSTGSDVGGQEGADPHERREAERVPQRPQPAERARDAVQRRLDVPPPLVGRRARRRRRARARRSSRWPRPSRRSGSAGRDEEGASRPKRGEAEAARRAEEECVARQRRPAARKAAAKKTARKASRQDGGAQEGRAEEEGRRQEEGEVSDADHSSTIVVRPVITEKSSAAYQERDEYTFEVHPNATKPAIRRRSSSCSA